MIFCGSCFSRNKKKKKNLFDSNLTTNGKIKCLSGHFEYVLFWKRPNGKQTFDKKIWIPRRFLQQAATTKNSRCRLRTSPFTPPLKPSANGLSGPCKTACSANNKRKATLNREGTGSQTYTPTMAASHKFRCRKRKQTSNNKRSRKHPPRPPLPPPPPCRPVSSFTESIRKHNCKSMYCQ